MSADFTFFNINTTDRLEFEELSANNYHQLVSLFENDSNPFVQEEYKSQETAKNYYNAYRYFSQLSPMTGNCDWFFKLKSTDEYIGLLNLYDLTFDINSDYHKMCSIGYAIGEKYRRKGLTKEAVKALIEYIFTELNLECITASTTNANVASRAFLENLGFSVNVKDHADDLRHKYFELWRRE